MLVQPGVNPQTAWTTWAQSTGHLDLLQLQIHGSGLSRSQLLPEAWANCVARASLRPGCATHEEVLMRWRNWQLGSESWIDPLTSLGRPSREDALINVSLRAQRALLDWLATDPEYCLPCSCQSCGQATRTICQHCLVGVCRECDNNTRHNLPVPCCLEMAGSNSDQTIQSWLSSRKLCCQKDQVESEPTCERKCPRVTCVFPSDRKRSVRIASN